MTHGPQTPDPTRRRSPVWMRVVLFVSLALNLAILGLVGGAVSGTWRHDEDRPIRISRELGLGPYLMALEKDDRRAILKASRARKDSLREGRNAWRQAFAESLAVLRSDPFDAMRMADLLEIQNRQAISGWRLGQDILVARLGEMSPEARRAFADDLENGIRGRDWRKGEPPNGEGHRKGDRGEGPRSHAD
ncbi:putative membrane protein [Aliiruegeria haliotis]|uniref:Putative membrane protein n=1 Tax=Aliiruegeria haliotis TaxID=1280846 RepID=A0A2T0RUS8_9RHOB|nr:periplasmic heavy metal sensor [Aliiruegeria haliotis]PRY24910.1 putative membrane protein [Aliiruegeria haliotis]